MFNISVFIQVFIQKYSYRNIPTEIFLKRCSYCTVADKGVSDEFAYKSVGNKCSSLIKVSVEKVVIEELTSVAC